MILTKKTQIQEPESSFKWNKLTKTQVSFERIVSYMKDLSLTYKTLVLTSGFWITRYIIIIQINLKSFYINLYILRYKINLTIFFQFLYNERFSFNKIKSTKLRKELDLDDWWNFWLRKSLRASSCAIFSIESEPQLLSFPFVFKGDWLLEV